MNPQISFLLNKSIESLRNSNLESAELYLKQVIKLQANNPHALRLLGVIAAQQKRYPEALSYLNASLKAFPKNPLTFSNLGNIFLDLKEYDKALDAYDNSIRIDPSYEEAWSNKGNALSQIARYEEALSQFDIALSLKPAYIEAMISKGLVLNTLKRFDEAIAQYDQVLSLAPNYHQAWANKGVTLYELGYFNEAIAHYDKALVLKPDSPEFIVNKGLALHGLERFDEAIAQYDQVLSLDSNYHQAWANKGVTLNTLKRFDEAITHYDKALTLDPNYHQALANKGVTLHELGNFNQAIAHYDQALTLNPNYHEASWNKSLSLLLLGNFENGLPHYEKRWQSKVGRIAAKRFSSNSAWLGVESLQGKTILLYGEQGLGDFIQFSRYCKMVTNLGAKVILEVPEPLMRIFIGFEGVAQLVVKGETLPPFDYQCSLLSLPLALKTNISNIPGVVSYNSSGAWANKASEWSARLGLKTRPRVGLVWSGNVQHKNDSNRSISLAKILPYLPSNLEYICLQKEIRNQDKLTLSSCPQIRLFEHNLSDFSDTAALINELDLVISVDTSVAHLAATLGKETWILLPYVPDWRWLLDRADSPWYPAAKLYRQTSIGSWCEVLEDMNKGLLELAS